MSRIHTPKEFARLRNEVKALNEELIFQRRENINNFERGASIAVEQIAKLEAEIEVLNRDLESARKSADAFKTVLGGVMLAVNDMHEAQEGTDA
jgi:wobble nucleotide-excising tRNase